MSKTLPRLMAAIENGDLEKAIHETAPDASTAADAPSG